MEGKLTKIRKEFILHGLSEKTQKAYLHSLLRLQRYYCKPLELLTKKDIKEFLFYLIHTKQLSQSSITITYCALQFYFKKIMGNKAMIEDMPRIKRKKKLPQALARIEIKNLINALTNLKHKSMLLTTYSGGLRVSETAHLSLSDIDSKRMLIRVNQGKGRKDRYTLLSCANLKWLREYYKQYRPSLWLFPGRHKNHPISIRTIQKVFDNAKHKAKIIKNVSVHSLRHSF